VTTQNRIEALADTAADWRDPEHPPRVAAVQDTIDAPNRWTQEALDHLLNRWMQQLTVEGLADWVGEDALSETTVVGVLHGESGPLSGFQDALAVWALGHRYIGAVPSSSPALLPAFAEAYQGRASDAQIRFVPTDDLYEDADVVLARPAESVESIREACAQNDLPESCRLIRPPVYSIGLVDGHESQDEMGRIAEDMLLLEGMGRRRLALLWAPRDHSPDEYLEAMAHFRGLFPAHEDTPGTLQMQQAFLEARDQPHAYADGLEFLMSRGEPDLQRPGHVRWSEYDEIEAVADWYAEHESEVYAVIARKHLHDQLPAEFPLRTPGGVHVPPLSDSEGHEVVSFLRTGAE